LRKKKILLDEITGNTNFAVLTFDNERLTVCHASIAVSKLTVSNANTNDYKFRMPMLLTKNNSETVEKILSSKFQQRQIIYCQKFSK